MHSGIKVFINVAHCPWVLICYVNDRSCVHVNLTTFSLQGFERYQQTDIELTLDDIRLFTSGLDLDEDQDDQIVEKLLETTCRVHMLRCEEEVKVY